jgi:hypothetical protein
LVRCPRCDKDRPQSQFGRDASRASGLAVYCRACQRAAARNPGVRRRAKAAAQPIVEQLDEERPPAATVAFAPVREFMPRLTRRAEPSLELILLVARYLAANNSRRAAAAGAGIGASTLSEWISQGETPEAQAEGNLYAQLANAVADAEGYAERHAASIVWAAAADDVQQAKWVLAVRHGWVRREEKVDDAPPPDIEATRERLLGRATSLLGRRGVAGGGPPGGAPAEEPGVARPPAAADVGEPRPSDGGGAPGASPPA